MELCRLYKMSPDDAISTPLWLVERMLCPENRDQIVKLDTMEELQKFLAKNAKNVK